MYKELHDNQNPNDVKKKKTFLHNKLVNITYRYKSNFKYKVADFQSIFFLLFMAVEYGSKYIRHNFKNKISFTKLVFYTSI